MYGFFPLRERCLTVIGLAWPAGHDPGGGFEILGSIPGDRAFENDSRGARVSGIDTGLRVPRMSYFPQ
jgi:hypothetical protein